MPLQTLSWKVQRTVSAFVFGAVFPGLLISAMLFGTPSAWAQTTITYAYDSLGRLVSVTNKQGAPAPVAVNDTITAALNTALTFDPRSNDSNPGGFALTISAVTQPAHGTVVINGGTSVTYTPASGYGGPDSFTYTISDAGGDTSSATVNVTFGLVARNDTLTTNVNVAASIDPRTNDTPGSGGTLTVSSVGQPAHGSTANNGGSSVTYTPTSNYVGADNFLYSVTNGVGGSGSATVSVTVVNNNPIASNYSTTVNQNVFSTISPYDSIHDPGASYALVTGVGTPSHGTASVTNSNYIQYEPTAGYVGQDSMSYTVTDSNGQSGSAMIFVTVADTPPTANADSIITNQNSPVTFDPRSNDTAPTGNTITITNVGTPSHGSAVVNGGSSITYTPATGFSGSDAFSYTIGDGKGGSASSTVNMTVNNPSTPFSASVSATSWYSSQYLSQSKTLDPPITVTPTSGIAPYTYAWQYVSGFNIFTATTPPGISSHGLTSITGYSDFTAQWRCQVTDSQGNVTYTPNVQVEFEHTNGN